MLVTQVLKGVPLPIMLMFVVILSNDRALMGTDTSGPLFTLIRWFWLVVVYPSGRCP
jgi:Mn2+/Fe2+ NRAMP family transporter